MYFSNDGSRLRFLVLLKYQNGKMFPERMTKGHLVNFHKKNINLHNFLCINYHILYMYMYFSNDGSLFKVPCIVEISK